MGRRLPKYRHLTAGFEQADSWATDAHKWPNVNYDSGIVLVKEGMALRAAMTMTAAYLEAGACREPMCAHARGLPESPRRGICGLLLSGLGRGGLCSLIEENLRLCAKLGRGLSRGRIQKLSNDVVSRPGAGVLRQRGGHAEGGSRRSGRWRMLVRRHDVAR